MQQTNPVFALPIILIGIACLVALSIGIFLFIRGRRGVKVDDHPVCRRCGFDLFGLPPGAERCSECGADLKTPKAIRIGNRRSRPAMAWVGGTLALIGLCAVALMLIAIARDVNWIEHMPTWYVMRDAQSNTAADRDPALKELLRRMSAGDLSDEQIAQIVKEQLVWQADANTTWVVERGDLIDSAHVIGKVPADQWSQYISHGVGFNLAARAKVRRRDSVPFRIEHFGDRCGSRTQLYLTTTIKLEDDSDLNAAKQNTFGGRNGAGSVSRNGRGSTGHMLALDPKLVAEASDGTKNLHLTLKTEIYDHQNPGQNEPPTVVKNVDLKTTWDLVPADAITVKKIEDNSIKAAVEKAISVGSITVQPANPNYVNLSINFNGTPVALACTVILSSGDREWSGGHIYVGKNQNSGWGTGEQVKNFDANTVDVIFRPDERTALDTIDLTEYWTGEAVIKNVKVTRLGQ